MHPAAALVLAGGRSSRFGSDKALALLGGEPLLARSLRAALGAFVRVALVDKDPRRYAALVPAQVALVADGTSLQTPLAGLLAGIEWSPLEIAFAAAVDMPFAYDPPLLAALFAAIEGRDAVMPVCRGQPQPLCALWRRGPALEEGKVLLARGAGPLQLLKALRTAELDWDDERPFLDVDTRADLAKLDLA